MLGREDPSPTKASTLLRRVVDLPRERPPLRRKRGEAGTLAGARNERIRWEEKRNERG